MPPKSLLKLYIKLLQMKALQLNVPLSGGKADGIPLSQFNAEALLIGATVELEHTNDIPTAIKIAADHLSEDKLYYSKLKAIHPEGNSQPQEDDYISLLTKSEILQKDDDDAIEPVHHLEFHSAVQDAFKTVKRIQEHLTEYKPEELAQMKTFLTKDRQSGYAVKSDGELVNVFSKKKGRGDHLVQHALSQGAKKLDCFADFLPKFYTKHGFVEHKREPNWTPGGGDVVYMYRPAKKALNE